jgi:curved DNA-binding protein CbpA
MLKPEALRIRANSALHAYENDIVRMKLGHDPEYLDGFITELMEACYLHLQGGGDGSDCEDFLADLRRAAQIQEGAKLLMDTEDATPSSPLKNHYQSVELNDGEGFDYYNKELKKLSLKWHPDKHVNSDKEKQIAAAEKFKEIQSAREVIGDQVKKAEYDGRMKAWLEYEGSREQQVGQQPLPVAFKEGGEVQEQLDEKQAIISKLERECDELKEQAQQCTSLRQDSEDMQQLEKNRAIIQAGRELVSRLEVERDELKQQLEGSATSDQSKEELQQQLQEKEVIISNLEQERDELSGQVQQFTASGQDSEDMQQQLEKNKAIIQAGRELVSRLEAERDELKQQLEGSLQQLQEKEIIISNLEQERDELSGQVQQFTASGQKIEDMQQQLEKNEAILQAGRELVSRLEAERDELKQQVEGLAVSDQSTEELKQLLQQSRAEGFAYATQLDEMDGKYGEALDELKAYHEEMQAKHAAELEKKEAQFTAEREEVRAQESAEKVNVEALELKVEALEAALAEEQTRAARKLKTEDVAAKTNEELQDLSAQLAGRHEKRDASANERDLAVNVELQDLTAKLQLKLERSEKEMELWKGRAMKLKEACDGMTAVLEEKQKVFHDKKIPYDLPRIPSCRWCYTPVLACFFFFSPNFLASSFRARFVT